jgi:hypothetical protein
MSTALWIVQALLAALFVFAGGMKLVMPIESMAGPVAFPGWFLRFIGVVELLGGLGLILPALTGLKTSLTPLAAAGLIIIMIGAIPTTMAGGDIAPALIPLIVGLLLAFVGYGRWKIAPHTPSAPSHALPVR